MQVDPFQGYTALFPALLDLVRDAEHEYVNTIIFTSYTDGDEIHGQYASARQMDTNGRLIIVTTKDGITTDYYPWTNNKANQVIYLNAGPFGLQANKIIQTFRCPTLPTVPALTTAVVPDPSTTTKTPTTTNTPPDYPIDKSYNPCKSYIIIAFEAASRVPDDIFETQKNFITQNLIQSNWTNPERMAFVAFSKSHIQQQRFHHYHDLASFQNDIKNTGKFGDPSQGYASVFPALLDLVHDAEHEYVNTIIFTSYTDGDEIHEQYASARQMDTNGRLIIVTTKDGITTDFYPWTNNKADQVIYLNAGPVGLQATKIIQEFRCPTLNP
uniref:VWFA domain-containing protein n=1 Tax=Panagrolaimus sp. JU765 TaxID=591449 RepID=A0AC34RGM3_9BILA